MAGELLSYLLQMTSDPESSEKTGVQINGKKVVGCASVVLEDVLTRLAPLVLPVSELVRGHPWVGRPED
jgi:hypothetical protein